MESNNDTENSILSALRFTLDVIKNIIAKSLKTIRSIRDAFSNAAPVSEEAPIVTAYDHSMVRKFKTYQLNYDKLVEVEDTELAGIANAETLFVIRLGKDGMLNKRYDLTQPKILAAALKQALHTVSKAVGYKVGFLPTKDSGDVIRVTRHGITLGDMFDKVLGIPGYEYLKDGGLKAITRAPLYFNRGANYQVIDTKHNKEAILNVHITNRIEDDGNFWLNPNMFGSHNTRFVAENHSGNVIRFESTLHGLVFCTDTNVPSEATISGILKGAGCLPSKQWWNEKCRLIGIKPDAAHIISSASVMGWSSHSFDKDIVLKGRYVSNKIGEVKKHASLPISAYHRTVSANDELTLVSNLIAKELHRGRIDEIVNSMKSYELRAMFIAGKSAGDDVDKAELKALAKYLGIGVTPATKMMLAMYKFYMRVISSPSSEVKHAHYVGECQLSQGPRRVSLVGYQLPMVVCQFRWTDDDRIVLVKGRGECPNPEWYSFDDKTKAFGPVFTVAEFRAKYGSEDQVVRDGVVRVSPEIYRTISDSIKEANDLALFALDSDAPVAEVQMPESIQPTAHGHFAYVSWIEGALIQGGDSDDTKNVIIGPSALNWRFRYPPVYVNVMSSTPELPEVEDVKQTKTGDVERVSEFSYSKMLARQIKANSYLVGPYSILYNTIGEAYTQICGDMPMSIKQMLGSIINGKGLMPAIDVKKHDVLPLHIEEIAQMVYDKLPVEIEEYQPTLLLNLMLGKLRLRTNGLPIIGPNDTIRYTDVLIARANNETPPNYLPEYRPVIKVLERLNSGLENFDFITSSAYNGVFKEDPELGIHMQLFNALISDYKDPNRVKSSDFLEYIYESLGRINVLKQFEEDIMRIDSVATKPMIKGTLSGNTTYEQIMFGFAEKQPEMLGIIQAIGMNSEMLMDLQYRPSKVNAHWFKYVFTKIMNLPENMTAEEYRKDVFFDTDLRMDTFKQIFNIMAKAMGVVKNYEEASKMVNDDESFKRAINMGCNLNGSQLIAFTTLMLNAFDSSEPIQLTTIIDKISAGITIATLGYSTYVRAMKYCGIDVLPLYNINQILIMCNPSVVREFTMPHICRITGGSGKVKVNQEAGPCGLFQVGVKEIGNGKIITPKLGIFIR